MLCLLTGCTYNGIEYFGHDENDTYELRAAYQSSVDYLLSDFNTKQVSERPSQEILTYDFIETSISLVGTPSDSILADESESTTSHATETRSIDGSNHKGESLGTFVITGYCPCSICCGKWSNPQNPVTASGAKAVAGYTIGVDPSVFKYGTKVIINNHVYEAQDTGGSISGKHIDMYFNTHREALAWGKKKIEVFAYKE